MKLLNITEIGVNKMLDKQIKYHCIPLKKELDAMGFFCMRAEPSKQEFEIYKQAKKAMNDEFLPFRPAVSVCFERRISLLTSFLIEGYQIYTKTGMRYKYVYDFYKASYFFNSKPTRIKLYGEELSRQDLFNELQHFKFLKEDEENGNGIK